MNYFKTFIHTTLYRSIGPINNDNDSYHYLEYKKGFDIYPRHDLVNPKDFNKINQAKFSGIISFIHMTDLHVLDATSPGRIVSLGEYIHDEDSKIKSLTSTFRPHEAFTCQVIESMVQQINNIDIGPLSGTKVSLVINTGDNTDTKQSNELRNYINLLDGQMVEPNPIHKYVGIQDNVKTNNFFYFYHPNTNQKDIYNVYFDYPNYKNSLKYASQKFKATGLLLPWYASNGNHDIDYMGNFSCLSDQFLKFITKYSTGNQLVQKIPFEKLITMIDDLKNQKLINMDDVDIRKVPASSKRTIFDTSKFIQEHFNTTSQPIGHGFTDNNIRNQTMYYTFDVSPEIKGIMLDTCNPYGNPEKQDIAPNGSIDQVQMKWLEKKLIQCSKIYYDQDGGLVQDDFNDSKLIILFSHHNSQTLDNNYTNSSKINPRFTWPALKKLLARFPNIILWVNGHTHYNYIKSHRVQNRIHNGFWEVNTASHIDFPQQSRVIEIVDHGEYLGIFTTLIDHLSPPRIDNCCQYTVNDLASVSRELSANNVYVDPISHLGRPKDRNGHLFVKNPFLY